MRLIYINVRYSDTIAAALERDSDAGCILPITTSISVRQYSHKYAKVSLATEKGQEFIVDLTRESAKSQWSMRYEKDGFYICQIRESKFLTP